MSIPLARIREVKMGDHTKSVAVPADPESQMNLDWKLYGEQDRFFPFWLEAWPSSYALYDYLYRKEITWDFAVEVGCGCGVFAQLAQELPGSILHTDLVPSACAFAKEQIVSKKRFFACMDMEFPIWNVTPEFIFAADVFYEYPLIELFAEMLRKFQLQAIVADPGRASRPEVADRLYATGLVKDRIPWNYQLDGQNQTSVIWVLGVSL